MRSGTDRRGHGRLAQLSTDKTQGYATYYPQAFRRTLGAPPKKKRPFREGSPVRSIDRLRSVDTGHVPQPSGWSQATIDDPRPAPARWGSSRPLSQGPAGQNIAASIPVMARPDRVANGNHSSAMPRVTDSITPGPWVVSHSPLRAGSLLPAGLPLNQSATSAQFVTNETPHRRLEQEGLHGRHHDLPTR